MLCPLCRKEYAIQDIGNHVDLCLSSNGILQESSSSKKPLLDREIVDTNLSKKCNTSPITKMSNINHYKTISNKKHVALVDKMSPICLIDYVGQEHVVGSNTVLQQLLKKGCIPSMIFWGPPGCGKSSLTNVISHLCKEVYADKVHIVKLSAISSGIASIKDVVKTAKNEFKHCQTIVFMDKIHRFNKLQQDIFLPHIEAGSFTLIGTTTENPSYSLNSALLSRCRVFVLNKLTTSNILEIICKAISSINGEIYDPQNKMQSNSLQNKLSFTPKPDFVISKTVTNWLAEVCDGNARVALNGLELAVKTKVLNNPNPSHFTSITLEDIKESLKQAHMLSDEESNNSHHLYSALHKSIKGGNANASLYWLARIMAAKEDPVDIARRLVRISSENIGLADPDALGIAVHTMHGCQMIGMPECDVLLGQCVVYLARAPKSCLVYSALEFAKNIIMNHKGPQPAVPLNIKSDQRKFQTIIGHHTENLVQKEENVKMYLPFGLEHTNFFLENF
ncbi:ATPase WRNIP1-like [Hylaeus volcanicus]|uniref:ATPase WRNIP1-like n=1 Tax=Hylaeus volcanicus TaxID=313075 RepID=UPI0023B80CFF|nr:ATPase WRNIP1-like [Hylaeus volcanicus]